MVDMRECKSAIVTAPGFDTDNPRTARVEHDTTVFHPEMRFIMEMHGVSPDRLLYFDNRLPGPQRLEQWVAHAQRIVAALPDDEDIDSLIFGCHGTTKAKQVGINTRNCQDVYKRALTDRRGRFRVKRTLVVANYCCSTGKDIDPGPGVDGGLADNERDAFCELGAVDVWTMGHEAVAHATLTGEATQFPGSGRPGGGSDSYRYTEPGTPDRTLFNQALRRKVDPDGRTGPIPATSLRGEYPWMSPTEVRDVLHGLTQASNATGNVVVTLPSWQAVQAVLNKALASKGVVLVENGHVGTPTKRALQQYQAMSGLKPDGRFGPITYMRMVADGYFKAAA